MFYKTKGSRMSTKKSLLTILGGFILLYIAITIVNLILGTGPNMLMNWLQVSPNVRTFVGSTLTYGLRVAAYIVLPVIALRKVLGIQASGMFFPGLGRLWKDMLYGFLYIAILLGGLFLVELNNGWLVLDGWNWEALPPGAWLRTAWTAFLVNVAVAVGEETVFRGYLLTSLNRVVGRWPALVLMMVIFGLFHLAAYTESGMSSVILWLGILLASLFGGLFGLVYLRTGSLWLPVVLHFTWNFMETDLLNMTGDLTNPNLLGALTRMQSPLTLNEVSLTNIVILESMLFAVIAAGILLWLRQRKDRQPLDQ
jgi:membrane protease YdiL (CAAX protease family)